MTDAAKFTWIPFYEQLADRLVAFRDRQGELLALLTDLKASGLPLSVLEDKDESGARMPLTEIDPFTFFGTFNRGITEDARIRMLERIKSVFGVPAEVPSDFSGVPVVNNQKTWFFAYRAERAPGDIDRLWDVFVHALRDEPMKSDEFGRAFERALEVRNTNLNLTIGLFWIRPRRFLSLDSRLRAHLKIVLSKEGLSFPFYRDTLARVQKETTLGFPELSLAAYLAPKPSSTQASSGPDVNYWMVGARWDDADPPDQTKRFLEEGIWQNGHEERHADAVKQMKPGDRIAIKAPGAQKQDLPFDSHGHTVSRMVIKARGTILRNRDDGRTVEVEWEPKGPPVDWYFYTSPLHVWRLRKSNEMAQHLIQFAFADQPQNYDYYLERWLGKTPSTEATSQPATDKVDGGEDDSVVDVAAAYSPADVLAEGVFLREEEVATALRRLESKKLLILQGAPGVGKTFVAKKLAYALMESRDDSRVAAVQFHPSYSYEDFVRGYRPTGEAGKFELKDGPFVRLCDRAAADPDRRYVLLIDEINRGHTSQVFGEPFMLLEADKRGRKHAVTPLYQRGEEPFFVPENVYVIGTMNIADRSLALVDFALRRRFAFLTLEPRFGDPAFRRWLRDRKMPDSLCQLVIQRLSALNERIAADSQLGPAFRVGHSFFCPRGDDFSQLDVTWYREIIATEIVPLLEEYWYDAPDKARAAEQDLLA